MPTQEKYTQRLGLANLDVFLETPENDSSYFQITRLPRNLGYGKYAFGISYKDPVNSDLLLSQGSGILFEFVDSNGETVYSELSDIPDVSGAATAYVWIKADPLWTPKEIADGPLTLYVVGQLDGVPEEYEGTYNVRSTFTYNVRKDLPNTSPIIFYDVPSLEASSSVDGTIQEFDRGSATFARGYIQVSSSFMQTHGGKVSFIELSYRESGSRTEDFTVLSQYPVEGETSRFELQDTGSVDGLNPISHIFKMPVPKDFRRETDVIFKLKFLDANKTPAKHYSEFKVNQDIEITSSLVTVNGSPFIIEKADNLLKGSMFTGQAVGKGFETSGRSSAFMKTVDYTGFKSASLGIGSPGVMFFSGSVLTSSGDDYDGVGLELVANSESFFRFRSNPSKLDVRADAFFVGSTSTQFISASGGTIEISSSNFHLEPGGDVTMAGTIEAADGKIGGFHISESRINSENEKIILKAGGQISASSLLLASGSFVVDPDNLSRFGQDGFQSFVMVENTGVVIQTSNFNLNTARFIISSSDVGMMAVGSTPPVAFNNGTGFFVDGDGNFLVGKSTGPRIQFDGFETVISSSNFFLGSNTQFVSGSNGNIEISSSNFHLDATGNVNMAGTITAEAGEIGGFSIGQGALSSDNFFISGAATGNELFISSSGFSVDAEGVVSASDLSLQGGSVGGLTVAEGTVSVGEILKLKDSGQITGSQVLFTGGKISGSGLDVFVPTFFLGSEAQFVSGSNGNIEITSSNFHLDKDGTVRMAGTITATAGKIAGWTISGDTLVGANATLDGAGSALFKSDQGPGTDTSAAFDQLRDEYYIDFTPTGSNSSNFYIKMGPNFMVDKDGILIASGASFAGTITASAGLIGGFVTDSSSFHDFNNNIFISGSPKLGGTHHPNFMFISSSNFNVKQSGDITGSSALFNGNTRIEGELDVIGTGTIASFGLTQTAISSSNSKLILKSSGQITGSDVLFNGGKIGGFVIDSDEIKSGTTMILDSDSNSGQIKLGAATSLTAGDGIYMDGTGDFRAGDADGNRISFDGTNVQLIADKFFLGGASQFVSGSNGNVEISSSRFHLDRNGNVDMSGTITATAGKIAGFTISGDSLTATNFEIDASGKRITLGDASTTDLFVADADEGIQLGNNTFGLAPFSVTKAGVLKAVAGTVGGYGISATAISSSNDNLILKNSGQITGSTVLFTGGKIGGFTIDADEIKSTNLLLDSNNEKITVGSANAITIQGGGTDNFIVMGSKTAFAQNSTAGVIIGMDNNVPSFDLTRNATNYVRFDTSTGVDIKTDTFKLDTSTLDIDSSTSRIQVINDSSNEVVRLGEISDSASDLYGIKIYDGSGTADSNTLVKLGGEGNTIGGWTITNNQIVSDNLVIHSSGRLETADFASGVKGWRISSEGNGEAEFENAKIRGTLSTAVFEKETVNAVGGQLYVANSTALTGSGQISASFATMSVVNVTGFVQGEILSLKKVNDTGFTTEYVFVNSSSRDFSSDTNFAGKLMVTRGYGSGSAGDSGSLGGSPATSQSYEPGQVIVSTGRVGTGYIRLNANPNDSATPFMDIVERTGTGIYDVGLKVRVGDLSGLSSATLFGNDDPGFGIFTENGFFKGGINATTGSFTGVVHINTSASEIMKLGTNVSGTNDGIFINNNNFLFTDGQFKTGNATNFLSHDGNGAVEIQSQNFTLKGGSKLLMTTQSLAFDTSNASTATRTAGTGIFMSSSGDFRVGNSSGNRLTFTGTSLELVTDDLNIDTSTFDLSTDGTGKIALGATPPTGIGSGTGFFVDGAGNFLAGNASGNFIRFNQSSGAVQVSGEITITAGDLAGVTKDTISGSAQSALNALEAGVSASIDNATGSLSSSLAGAIGDVSSSAGQGISSANAATAAASTAQSAIDDMETQVVLNSGGMDLRNESNLNLVSYGTTTKFFDGVGQTDAHQKLRLNTDGVFAFGNTTQSFARFFDEGVQIVSGGIERAKFATTTTIGNPSFEHVEITSASLKLKGGANGNTTRLSMDADGMQIGSVSNGITLNASGDATFNGAITIQPSDLPSGTVSGSAQLADSISGSLGQTSASLAAQTAATAVDSASMAASIQLTSNGMNILNSGGAKLAEYGTNVFVGLQNAEHVKISTSGLELKDNTDVVGKFVQGGATLGKTGGAHISASTTDVSIIRNANNKAVISADGMKITQGGNEVADFGSTVVIGEVGSGKSNVQITSGAINLRNNTTNKLILGSDGSITIGNQFSVDSDGDATFAGTLQVGGVVSSSAQLADAISGSSGDVSASLAADTAATLVDSASMASSVQITSTGLNVLDNSSNKLAQFSNTVTVGRDDGTNQNVFIDNDSIDIRRGNQVTASFGATTTIGSTDSAHTFIDSGSFRLKDASDIRLQMDAKGIRMGEQFSVDSSGNATFSGNLSVGSLPSGTVTGSAQLADAISGSIGSVSASLAEDTAATLVDSASVAASVQITSEGLNILNSSADKLAEYGTNVFVGLQDAEHVKIGTSGLELKQNNTVLGKFIPDGVTIGDTTKQHISASTLSVNIVDGDGKVSASFGEVTTIGSDIGQHVKITSDALELKTASDVTVLSASNSGLEMQGTVRANAGEIGGFTIDADEIKAGSTLILDSDSSSGQIKLGAATSLTAGDGIYMDGTGDFRAGDADGNRISFDGTNVQLIADKFFLGGASQFVSGSNSNIEISSSNFHIDRLGNVTANNFTGSNILVDGDITATTGIFKDVTVAGVLSRPIQPGAGNLGSVVPGAYFSGSGDKNYVESWFPLNFSKTSGDPTVPFTDMLTCLTGSVWGWSGSIHNPGDSQTAFDTLVGFQCLGYEAAALDADASSDVGTNLPPRSQFRFVSETEGQAFYESNATSWTGVRSTVDSDLKPRMYIEFYPKNPGSGAFRELKLTSNPISLPISGSDFATAGSTTDSGLLPGGEGLKELILEYCIRPVGEFAGFVPTYTTRIIKASDNSELFVHVAGGTESHGQPVRWEAISIPMVNAAQLVTFPTGTSAGGVIEVERDIRIEIEIRADGPSAGGGTPDGFILTEMRFRKAAFANGLSANAINTNILTSHFKPSLENFINVLSPLRVSDTDVVDTDLTNSGDKSEYTQNEPGKITLAKFTGDPSILFRTRGSDKFTVGVDDSDSDVFKIDSGASLSDDGDFELTSAGNASFAGDVVAFHTSDERLKDNVRLIDRPIEKIKTLRGVEYEWNDRQSYYESGSLDSGIIAQDVQKVLPQLVKERKTGYLGVRHDRLVGLLIEAIKEQQVQIEDMKDKIKELEDGSSK